MGEAKRRRRRRSAEACAYCGEPATGSDHVPPKNLFDDRTGLITVPACEKHNNKRSGLDERFREFVVLSAPNNSPAAKAIWQPTLRGLNRNPRRKAELISSAFPIPGTEIVGALYDASVFHEMIESIARGLYWHHYQTSLPLTINIETVRLQPDALGSISLSNRRRVAGDQFWYAFDRIDESPTVTAWLFAFHRKLFAWALTDVETVNRVSPTA